MTKRRPPPRKGANPGAPGRGADPGGRPLLCLLAIVFALAALFRHDLLAVPFLLGAMVLAILFAFHSRVGGPVGLGKASVPIVPDASHPYWRLGGAPQPEPEEEEPIEFRRQDAGGGQRRARRRR